MCNMRGKQHSDFRSVHRTVVIAGVKGIFNFLWHPYIYIYIYSQSHPVFLGDCWRQSALLVCGGQSTTCVGPIAVNIYL